jgi:hypothetical protein
MEARPTRRSDRLNNQSQNSDVFQVVLTAPDHASLANLVRELGLDIDHQHPPGIQHIRAEHNGVSYATAN